jgi:extracellular elastinolytic metalloproteinase
MLICFSTYAQKHSKSLQGKATISLEQLIKKKDNSIVISKENTSSLAGIKHIYLRQAINGIEVLGTESSLHIAADGTTLKTNNNFVENVSATVSSGSASMSASQVITAVSQKKGYSLNNLNVLESAKGLNRKTLFTSAGISNRTIPAKLVYFQDALNGTRIAWDISIDEITSANWYNYIVDAATGNILATYNWTISCNILGDHDSHDHSKKENVFVGPSNKPLATTPSATALVGSYLVYPMPVESPNFGGASVVTDPDNAIASPFGWHDTNGTPGAEFTVTRGNNVNAY